MRHGCVTDVLQSIGMDVPDRERLGWLGDVSQYSEAAMRMLDTTAFFENQLRKLSTTASPESQLHVSWPPSRANHFRQPCILKA